MDREGGQTTGLSISLHWGSSPPQGAGGQGPRGHSDTAKRKCLYEKQRKRAPARGTGSLFTRCPGLASVVGSCARGKAVTRVNAHGDGKTIESCPFHFFSIFEIFHNKMEGEHI